MTLQQKLTLKLQQKMILTPTLQQAIRLLQLTRLDLLTEVAQELETNPVLEEANTIEESEASSLDKRAEEQAAEESPIDSFEKKIDVESYFQDFVETNMKYRGIGRETPQDAPDSERYLSQPESLGDHLMWQVSLTRMGEKDREIAGLIVGNLRKDGYLSASMEEIAAAAGVKPEEVEKVLALIQLMDPVGVASRTLEECLRIQLAALGNPDPLAMGIVTEHLPLLERESPARIAQRLGVPLERLEEALAIIRQLDPKPGLQYNTSPNPAVVPDVVVEKDGDNYRVVLNEDGMPKLRLSSRYRAMAEADSPEQGKEVLVYLREKVRAAMWFLKSIEERQRTIYKVAKEIVSFQRDFLDKGPSQMRPLVLRDVAERIGMHESTVSRVVSNKYMQTPRGILPMKYFFNTGIGTLSGVDVSSLRVKERIKILVEEEPPEKPHSDQQLADRLKREGILLARRTVAKYREELHIPSSGKRKGLKSKS